MKKYFVLSLLALGLFCACNREAEAPQYAKGSKTITAVLPETKTFLGEKEGTAYPNYWAAGDVINVNGVSSDPLDNAYDGKTRAEFSINLPPAPLYAVYPTGAVLNYDNGEAALTLPSVQNYVAGSYDPEAYVMIAHSDTEGPLAFEPLMSLFKFVPSGSVNIASVKLIVGDGKKLSGTFSTDFTQLIPLEGASNTVTLDCPDGVVPGTPIIMAIPAGDYTDGLAVVFTDVEGGVMARRATPSKPYEAGKMYSTDIDYEAAILYCEAEAITSSSVVVTWSSDNPEDNINRAFDIMVYSDEACANLVETLSIPANADCWATSSKNWHLRFVVGGLSQGTQYWFKVKDNTKNSVSEACTATTTAFTVVPMPTADISATGVAYAEDFSEFAWGWDRIFEAGGFLPADQSSLSNHSTEGATFVRSETASTTGMRAAGLDAALTASRLDGWLSEGNTYYMPGYLKLGSSNSYGFVLTPKFPIAEGKLATANVTIKGSRFGEEESETWMLCVVSNDGRKGTTRESDFAWPDVTNPELYREVQISEIGKDWKTVTVEGFKMGRGDCIAFGRTKNGSNSIARVFLSEISVEVTAITDAPTVLTATLSEATSSSLVFTWDGSPDDAYTATLYSDEACTEVVESFVFPAGDACWRSKAPEYIFGGLTPDTDYWLKVVNTTKEVESNVATGKTEKFTIVQMPESITGKGVVLAEDFGELRWHSNMVLDAAGFVPSNTDSFSSYDVANYVAGNSNSGEKKYSTVMDPLETSRLKRWAVDSNVYYHCGYLKMGSASAKGWILTPQFSVPTGKKATVTVTVTAARYNKDQETEWAIAVLTNTETNMQTDYTCSFSWPATKTDFNYKTVTLSENLNWETVSVTGLNVYPGDRIVFGAKDGSDKTKTRVMVDDIKVEVTNISDAVYTPIVADLLDVSSSTLSFTWNEGGVPAEDANLAYTATIYSDEACSTVVKSYTFAAGQGSSLWRDRYPKFIFAGLSPDTQYYFRVSDAAGQLSNVVEAKTDPFTVVQMPESITANGVVLAEDFSLFVWDFEHGYGCAGMAAPASPTDFSVCGTDPVLYSNTSGNYQVFTSPAFATSRLKDWARDKNTDDRMMVHPGHITIGSFSNNKKAWLLTPKIPIPDDKSAIITVKITVRKGHEDATGDYTVGVLSDSDFTSDQGGGTHMVDANTSDFAWPGKSHRNSTNYQTFTVNNDTEWQTITFEGLKIYRDDRVVVGSRADYDYSTKKSCLNLSEITVTVTSMENLILGASALEATSSTLSFTWNRMGREAFDANRSYTAALYSDATCNTEVEKFEFQAGKRTEFWGNKYPRFIFAGLSPNTQYYFKVGDAAGKYSNVVSAKTSAFTAKTMPSSISTTGLAFAEDFSLFVWDFDYGQGCSGMQAPDSPTKYDSFGTDPIACSESTGSYPMFTSNAFSSSRLNKWARDKNTDAKVLVHPGYVTLGSSAQNEKSWILTPEFPIVSGKVATVTISITVRKGLTGATGDYTVGILNNSSNDGAHGGGANMQNTNTSDFNWPDDRPATIYNEFTVDNGTDWQTFTFTGMQLKANDRIVVGARAGYSYSSKICCVSLSDITVTVTAIN